MALAVPAIPALASTGPATTGAGIGAASFARAEVAHYGGHLPAALVASGTGVDSNCFSPVDNRIDPEVSGGRPTNPAWYQRDALNQYCATVRLQDQISNPAYGLGVLQQGSALWLQQLADQVGGLPGHVHGGFTTLVPGSQAADSFRTVGEWEARTGGQVIPVKFPSADGAQLEGNVWLPPPGAPATAGGRYPGVVITDGSVQGYQNLYYWAAEGLAQYGYEVMTYDVQGQGDSDAFPAGARTWLIPPAVRPACPTSRTTTSIRAPRTRSATSCRARRLRTVTPSTRVGPPSTAAT